MLKLLFNPDHTKHFYLACSGGVDSMAAADFFHRGKKNFTIAYFNHNTPQASSMEKFLQDWSWKYKVPFIVGRLNKEKPKDKSPEEFWRDERYKWLLSFGEPVITCHHLNDVAETWIFSSLHGKPKLIAPTNGLVSRPFLISTKEEMISWCKSHGVDWIEDASNNNVKYPRNRIRHNILPECLKVNPGLLKVLKKKIISETNK